MAKRVPRVLQRRAGPPAGREQRSNYPGVGAWIGVHSQAGVVVTPETALNFSAVFAAINIISTDVACLPTQVYARTPGGGMLPDPEHPLYDLLLDEPNDEVDAFHFTGTLFSECLGIGNGYGEILRSRRTGRAGQIVRIDPRDVHPARDRAGRRLRP